MASFVPDPMVKCAVCAASPSSTTLPSCHDPHRTVRKLIHVERFDISRFPPSVSAKSASQNRMLSPSAASASPAERHTDSGVSTMNVLVSASNGYPWTWNIPCSVSRNTNVNARNTRSVPNQMYRVRWTSMVGRNASARLDRVALWTPSAAATRSASAARANASGTSASNRSSTPSERHRPWRTASSRFLAIAVKTWPRERTIASPNTTSMALHRANESAMSSYVDRSASRREPSVSSLNTTPHPNVASGAFRSITVTSCDGSPFFMSSAK